MAAVFADVFICHIAVANRGVANNAVGVHEAACLPEIGNLKQIAWPVPGLRECIERVASFIDQAPCHLAYESIVSAPVGKHSETLVPRGGIVVHRPGSWNVTVAVVLSPVHVEHAIVISLIAAGFALQNSLPHIRRPEDGLSVETDHVDGSNGAITGGSRFVTYADIFPVERFLSTDLLAPPECPDTLVVLFRIGVALAELGHIFSGQFPRAAICRVLVSLEIAAGAVDAPCHQVTLLIKQQVFRRGP